MATDIRLKEHLPTVTDRIVETYADCPRIQHLDRCRLPSRHAIYDILDDLWELLYPGFGRRQNLRMSSVEYHVGGLVVALHDKLTAQISRALQHDCPGEGESLEDFERVGQEKAVAFLDTIPTLRGYLNDDVQAAYDGDPAAAGTIEVVFSYPGIEAVTFYRVAHELFRLGVPLIPRMITEYAHSKTGIDIHPGAKIGRSFFIDHGTGVVIGETCEIGDHVKLYQGVTLGALSFPKDDSGNIIRGTKRHPTIEDHVVIYASATILGGETTIGHHSVIGSSVWLVSSVEPHTLVTMESPRLRFRDGQQRTAFNDHGHGI